MNLYSSAGDAWNPFPEAKINGRMYKELPSFVGIKALSRLRRVVSPSIKYSCGSCGIHILSAEILKRLKFSKGLNKNTSSFLSL